MIKNWLQKIFHDFIPDFGITAFLAFAYMLNLIWIISYEVALPQLREFLSLYVAIYVIYLIIVNMVSSLLTRFMMLSTQCFKGIGSFAQTRRAILYSFITLLPVNILSCVLQFTFHQPNPNAWTTLKIFAYLGIILSLVFAFGFLVISIARSHNIRKVYAFVSVLISFSIVASIALMFSWLNESF